MILDLSKAPVLHVHLCTKQFNQFTPSRSSRSEGARKNRRANQKPDPLPPDSETPALSAPVPPSLFVDAIAGGPVLAALVQDVVDNVEDIGLALVVDLELPLLAGVVLAGPLVNSDHVGSQTAVLGDVVRLLVEDLAIVPLSLAGAANLTESEALLANIVDTNLFAIQLVTGG